jgi:Uma2 family endonuclease
MSSVSPPATVLSADRPDDFIWRLSVSQYHEMIHSGILTADDRVELLEGWLIAKRPKNPPHRISTRLTHQSLSSIIPPGWYVDSQEPITLEDSEPEPDAVIVRGDTRLYRDRHPGPADVAIVIEVDATLERDRGMKKRVYARARIPVYWIINLTENLIEVYTLPSGPTEQPDYHQRQDFTASESVPVIIEGREVARLRAQELMA